MDIDCTEDKQHVRVKDPTNQQSWEVWCEGGEATWVGERKNPASPDLWMVQGPDGGEPSSTRMDGVLTKATLIGWLSELIGDEGTAHEVVDRFDPVVDPVDHVIQPSVYTPNCP
jgi:hypothetical protein